MAPKEILSRLLNLFNLKIEDIVPGNMVIDL